MARLRKTDSPAQIAGRGISEIDSIKQVATAKRGRRSVVVSDDSVPEHPANSATTKSVIVGSDSTEVEPETAAEEQLTSAEQSATEQPPESTDDSVNIQDAISELKRHLENQYQSQIDSINQVLADRNDELKAEREKARQAAQERDNLAAVFKNMGNPNPRSTPMVNTVTSTRSDKPFGAASDAVNILMSGSAVHKRNDRGQYVWYDQAELDRFVRANRKQLIPDMERWAKDNGLLRGNGRRIMGGSDAATTKATVPEGFLDVLSAMMRMTHQSSYIFWQFPTTVNEFDRQKGDTIRIPRFNFLPALASSEERLLSGADTFVPISGANQAISETYVSAMIQEYGLGKEGAPPVAIPAFVEKYSMLDLMSVLQNLLQVDYWRLEDKAIRELWDVTSRVVYNEANEVTVTPGNVGSGEFGTMTRKFLAALYGYMRTLQIPTYMDGCYGIVMPTTPAMQLKKDLDALFNPATPQQLQDLTNIMNPSLAGEMERVSGYLGQYENFHIFETNAYGTGAAGTEGVQTTTFGTGNVTTRTSYAFGANSIGRGIGTPFNIRRDDDTNFGRLNRFIWLSEEAYKSLDVDPTGTGEASQQLRVIDVRTSDLAV